MFVSIVGIGHIPIPYYKGKPASERLVAQLPHDPARDPVPRPHPHAIGSATNRHRRRLRFSLPGKTFRGYRDGANLTPPDNPKGGITFAEYLTES